MQETEVVREWTPSQIAFKQISIGNGKTVAVVDASDERFQFFVSSAGIFADVCGFSFAERCELINIARRRGIELPFVSLIEEAQKI